MSQRPDAKRKSKRQRGAGVTSSAPAPAPAPEPEAPRRKSLLLSGLGVTAGCALLGLVLLAATSRPWQAEAQVANAASNAAVDRLLARVAQLEAKLDGVVLASEETAAKLSQQITDGSASASRRHERFLAAALMLRSSIASDRPYLREYEAMTRLATEDLLPGPVAEILVSHAARGIPTRAELRERFTLLAPQIVARLPRQGDLLDSALSAMRGAAAGVGLTAPPNPTAQEEAVNGILRQLRRDNLGAAVADAAALDPAVQPLLSGWLSQARARLSVEQALHETLLRLLAEPI